MTEDEADIFLSEIPVLGEKEESEATVSDHMLHEDSADYGNLVPKATQDSLESLVESFTESQQRAFNWLQCQLEGGQQVCAAIVGPAGTGKSYLLRGLIELSC